MSRQPSTRSTEQEHREPSLWPPPHRRACPHFTADTTHGNLSLSDFAGSWLILFSHPADFTPVCTTEFIAFAAIADELQRRNVNLLGLSIDSTTSHIARVRTIKEKFGVQIPFPIIADLNKEVASAYGMFMPGESETETSRAVFVIDEKGVTRAMIYYPLTTGRNMDEILRLVDALQTSDAHQVATPANWRPGLKAPRAWGAPLRCAPGRPPGGLPGQRRRGQGPRRARSVAPRPAAPPSGPPRAGAPGAQPRPRAPNSSAPPGPAAGTQ